MSGLSLGTLGIILFASLGWAGLDTLRKALAERVQPLVVACLVLLIQGGILGIWLALTGEMTWPGGGYWVPGALTIAIGMLSNWLFVKALAASDLSRTIPLLSLTPVITAVAAIPILGEIPSAQQWLGIGIVVVGALVLNAKHGNPFKGLAQEPGALMMAAVALLWAVAGTIDKRALEFTTPEVHGILVSVAVGGGLGLLLLMSGRGREMKGIKQHPALFFGAGLAGAIATLLQLMAFDLTHVSLVETIKRAVGLISAVVVGRLLFKEAITPRALLAIALMGVGSGLLVL